MNGTEKNQKTSSGEKIDRRKLMLEAALNFAKLGFTVYPAYPIVNGVCSCRERARCTNPGKHPRTKHGFKDATVDPKAIRQFWQSGHVPNIGLATGGNFVVLDFDKKSGGLETLRALEAQYGPMPHTPTVLSGGGGVHYYFKHPGSSVKSISGIRPGLDIRGDKGSIIAVPSLHLSGQEYRWAEGKSLSDIPPAELPPWFSELRTDKTDKNRNTETTARIEDGTRNATLFKRACRLLRDGFSREAVYAAISADNQVLCKPPMDDSEIKLFVSSAFKYRTEWDSPQPLPELENDAPELDLKIIPKSLRGWVQDVSERMQVPLDMVAIPMLVGLAGIIGRRIRILPKKHDDWEVIPNLWGGVVAPPSSLKSPVFSQALSAMYTIQMRLNTSYQEALKVYELQNSAQQDLLKQLESKLAKATASGEESDQVEISVKILALQNQLDEKKPRHIRLFVNDVTTEKLIEILSDNPNGTLLFRDELYGFLMSLEKKGREGDRPFYLESWSGNTPFSQDRVGRGSVRVDALCLSILGGTQPARLKDYFESLLENGDSDDGFLQRFQLLVWPKFSKDFKLIDRQPNKNASDSVQTLFNKIVALETSKKSSLKMHFSQSSQAIFNAWLTELEYRVRSGQIPSSAFASHLGKFRSLMPSLAGIFQLIEDLIALKIPGEISSANTALAIQWCEYLEGHAKKIYAGSINPELRAAHLLAARIASGDIFDGMSIRDLTRNQWSGLKSRDRINLGLDYLQKIGWLKQQEIKAASGAPSHVIRLNPGLSLPGKTNGSDQ